LTHVSAPPSLIERQSAFELHCTQLPPPSHTLPPLSLQMVPWMALVVPHVPVVHVFVLQSVVCAGQSVAKLHWTQLPVALHTRPPLSVQAVPNAAFDVPQQVLRQVFVMHALAGAGQLAAVVQAMAPSQTLASPPLPSASEPSPPASPPLLEELLASPPLLEELLASPPLLEELLASPGDPLLLPLPDELPLELLAPEELPLLDELVTSAPELEASDAKSSLMSVLASAEDPPVELLLQP
jgi:hypothetical protein